MPKLKDLKHRQLFILPGIPSIIYSKIDPISNCCNVTADAEREDTHTYVLIGLDTEVNEVG